MKMTIDTQSTAVFRSQRTENDGNFDITLDAVRAGEMPQVVMSHTIHHAVIN